MNRVSDVSDSSISSTLRQEVLMLCLKKLNRSQLPHPICPLLSKMRKSAEIRLALKNINRARKMNHRQKNGRKVYSMNMYKLFLPCKGQLS